MVTLDLSYTTNLNVSLGISEALNVQMSPFIFQQHSFIPYCMQQSYCLMCEQWPMLNETDFSQTQSQQADDHITKSSMCVVLTELLSTASAAGPWGGRGGHLSAFAPLEQPFLLIAGGAAA